MPGLCGLVGNPGQSPDLEPLLDSLCYERAGTIEQYRGDGISIGCVHLGTGGQENVYNSPRAVVSFCGYLTHPSIVPGSAGQHPAAAPRFVHDAYLKKGEGMLQELKGTFAFALWDKVERKLLLACDRLGLRYVYYAWHDGILSFASEVKALLTTQVRRELDYEGIATFFYFGHPLGDATFFKGIRLLPPGSFLRYRDGRWETVRYWRIEFPSDYPPESDEWFADRVHEAIYDAVSRMIKPGLRYALSLSGGMDSRWIAAVLGDVHPDALALTFGPPESDDVRIASQIADRAGLRFHNLPLPPSFLAEHAERITYISDGMYSLTHAEEYPLARQLSRYADVSSGGFLGGLVFGREVNPLVTRIRQSDIMRYILWRGKKGRMPDAEGQKAFGPARFERFKSDAVESLRRCIAEAPPGAPHQVVVYVNLSHRQRRRSFAAQLFKTPYAEIYHPFADDDVIRISFGLLPPDQLLIQRAYRRALAKHYPALAELPWTLTLLPPTVSVSAILWRRFLWATVGKLLKNTPFARSHLLPLRHHFADYSGWFKGLLRPFVMDQLLDPQANATGLFDPDGLHELVLEHVEGRANHTNFLGRALAFAVWTRLFYRPATPVRPVGMPVKARHNQNLFEE